MEQRRLSIRMIEQMDCCGGGSSSGSFSYYHNSSHGGTSTSSQRMMMDLDLDGDVLSSTNTSTSDLSCQLAQSRGVATTHNFSSSSSSSSGGGGGGSRSTTSTGSNNHRMKPPMTIYSHNNNRHQYHPQQHHHHHHHHHHQRQDLVLPQLRSESSKTSINTSFSSNTTNTTHSIGSSSITFYQSPTKENYVVDQIYDQSKELYHPGRESKQIQRGIDRSITLPRETHLQISPNTPVAVKTKYNCNLMQPASPVLTTISPNRMSRNSIERTKSNLLSPTTPVVTPEITSPNKKTVQRNASTSSILCMPPLYPSSSLTSPPQRPPLSASLLLTQNNPAWRTMRSSASPVPRRHLFHNMAPPPLNMEVNEPSATILTPRSYSTNNNNTSSVNTTARTAAAMCISPPNMTRSVIPSAADVVTDITTAATSTAVSIVKAAPVMLDIAPGVQIHLRGADETQMAINTGFYIQCECMVCSVSSSSTTSPETGRGNDDMYCILDCDYFICPTCRSVHPNPISTNSNAPTTTTTSLSSNHHGARYPGGLGLGFRLEQ